MVAPSPLPPAVGGRSLLQRLCSPRARTQLAAILRKNAILTFRNRKEAMREFGMPLLMLIVLVMLSNLPTSTEMPAAVQQPVRSMSPLSLAAAGKQLWVAPGASLPPTDLPSRIVASLTQAVNAGSTNVTYFPCELASQCDNSVMAAYAQQGKSLLAAVIVDSVSPPSYRIRMDTVTYAPGVGAYNTSAAYAADGSVLPPDQTPGVYTNYFMPVQAAVDAAIIQTVGGVAPQSVQLRTQGFPAAAYTVNTIGSTLQIIVPIYMTFIFTLQVRVLLTRILEEKEKKIKITLKMMGLSDEMFWASWSITSLVKMSIVITLVVAIACLANIFRFSNFFVVWLLFFCFMLTCISFCFALTAIFSKSRTGGAIGMLIYLVLAAPSYGLRNGVVPPGVKLLISLLAPCAFNLGTSIITTLELQRTGANWHNIDNPNVTPAGVSLSSIMGMLVLDAVLYMALAWYLDKVMPTEFGTSAHPLFCCGVRRKIEDAPPKPRRKTWPCARRQPNEEEKSVRQRFLDDTADAAARHADAVVTVHNPTASYGATLSSDAAAAAQQASTTAAAALLTATADVESVSPAVAALPGVHIRGLHKVFYGNDGARAAVDNLSIDMYDGQVTCLLGHNGAGKTTTVSILTGLIAPTAGDAVVFGASVVNDIARIRDMTGVCPQHDILFDDLTVDEHLQLFGGLKGLRGVELTHRMNEMLTDLGLQEKRNARASTLSGGQKRRVSVAIAMMGDPRLLLLDEPTSGLDPAARRQVWGMIQKHKQGRVIILTTHFMDEADILGDRIALMARGRLRVAGSSLYLKKKFGAGYHLSVLLPALATVPSSSAMIEATPEVQQLLRLVRTHVPTAAFASALRTWLTDDASHAGSGAAQGNVPLQPYGNAARGTSSHTAYEVAVTLPSSEVAKFPNMFEALDSVKAGMSRAGLPDALPTILTYSISITTLEEVFLRLSMLVEEEEARERSAKLAEAAAEHGDKNQVSPTAVSDASPAEPVLSTDLAVDVETRAGRVDATWWLDVRRRSMPGHSATAHQAPAMARSNDSTFHTALSALLPTARKRYIAGTWRYLVRQISVQMWRRYIMFRRNPRALWLQCITPIIFVAAGAIFRVLRQIDTANSMNSVYMTPAGFAGALPGDVSFFSLPLSYLSAATTSNASVQAVLSNLPSAPASPGAPVLTSLPGVGVPTTSAAMAAALTAVSYAAASVGVDTSASAGSFSLLFQYNNTLTNVLPTLLNMWSSAQLRTALHGPAPAGGEPGGVAATIFTQLQPLPTTSTADFAALGSYLSAALMGFYIALGFVTIPAIQAANVVQERETLVKSLQMIMGSTPAGYWCATWLWDAAQFLVTWLGSIVVIFVTSAAFFPTVQAGGAVVLLLLLFGIAIPGPTYALSFLFKRHAEAQMWIRLGFTGATVVLYFSTFVLDLPVLSNPALGQVSTGISYVAMLFPPYALAKGFSDIVTKSACSPIFAMMGVPCVTLAPMAWDVAGAKCLYMALSVPVWAAILLFVEARVGRSQDTYASYVAPNAAENAALEDDDVVAERRRVDALPQQRTEERNAHPLLVQHLRKVYPAATRPKVAVADLSAAVEMGEVFGLLGPNGAGKTSTLSMLVGEVRPTSGDAYLHATSITSARRDAVRSIGYCPQFDALFELLTGEENLRYYAAINGVPDEHLPRLITAALQALDLTRYRHTLVRAYSGGNRRRLSLAVAYIAAPPIVFLDECSTGVDPFARRRMFDVINAARHGRSTVMTTHVMEEADGLCTRIGIMVDGRLSCLGSSQHLKAKYGKGYTVEVHLQQPASPTPGGAAHAAEVMVLASPSLAGDVSHGTVAAVTTLLNASAHQVRLLENNTGHLRYEVAELHLPQLFRSLEGARAALGIRDFSVSQTTLESVFLRFSRMQESLNDKHERS